MGGIAAKGAEWLGKLTATAGMAMRIALLSRPCKVPAAPEGRELLVMGNGPSLNETLATRGELIESCDTMAVNFAANTPEFRRIKPEHYVLADPHFFAGEAEDPNVARLWRELEQADWKLNLHVDRRLGLRRARRLAESNSNITVAPFNMAATGGFCRTGRWAMARGLAMPRPRNVMIPALTQAMRMGYRQIWLAGADHTWTRTLDVDNRNRVISVQPHFYADNNDERDRVDKVYAGVRLHQVLGSMAIAFASYWELQDYALRHGIAITNITPGSMIDAFPRG